MQPMKFEWYDCTCKTPEHAIRFVYDPDEGDLWIETYLYKYPWYHRMWIAFLFVFGIKYKYGRFSETILDTKDVQRLIELLEEKKKHDLAKPESPSILKL